MTKFFQFAIALDRGEGTSDQDRRRDHDAARRLALDDQIGANSEHRRLQYHTQDFGQGSESAGNVRGSALQRHHTAVRLAPTHAHAAGHSHRVDHFGVTAARFGKTVARDPRSNGFASRLAGENLGQDRERNQEDGAAERRYADPGWKTKARNR